ncbi:MAG: RNA-binding protein [Gammaproteobacteria bacterium]|nr:RNA-binding protein [Gammaproteobacteria bacterium]NIN61556.1 RNA-binding protein [Gammaproteobacteria bacterium]NIO62750.1 RNA-binding protein [Gammaproteobacteria bacterium]NIQ09611.1 RNA-binding protein [Gammaproteobacteria bacterium]NIQ19314.1 RNA-binding protein [Gammaproteobacteria bacterium]
MSPVPKQNQDESVKMRLDKWLWCARFYKTRNLAIEAIKTGKISVNQVRAKPSRKVQVGDYLIIRRGAFTFNVELLALSSARKSAKDAMLLYRENQDSIDKREELARQMKLDVARYPRSRGRPTKRDRRDLIRFKNKS